MVSLLVTEGIDSDALACPPGAVGRGLCLGKKSPSPVWGGHTSPIHEPTSNGGLRLVKPTQTSEIPGSLPLGAGGGGGMLSALCSTEDWQWIQGPGSNHLGTLSVGNQCTD